MNGLPLVDAARMREMDRRTIAEIGIPGLTLMEAAGTGLVRAIVRRYPGLARRRIVVVCGKGNNGGDGLVVARLLRMRGLWPRVLLSSSVEALSPEARVNAERARAVGLVLEPGDPARSLDRLGPGDLLIDALLGTGVAGPARDASAAWIDAMNRSAATVYAVDIPSGLSADRGALLGPAVAAQATGCLAHAKAGAAFPPAQRLWGEVEVIDIGIPDAVTDAVGPVAALATAAAMRVLLPRPDGATHKGDWGKLVLVGGSPGTIGAVVLAASAALRSGIGLLRVALPGSQGGALGAHLTEAMTIPLPEGEDGQPLARGAERILSGFGDWDALAVGPGLGRTPEAERLVLKLLGKWRAPMVIDADGLNALAAWGPDSWVPRAREVRAGGEPGGLVLTPHLGEMSRLSGLAVEHLREDPIGQARAWAGRWGVTLLLKGAPTVIAGPDGQVTVNSTGNSGLATGGSGDVLTGMVGALLAQGLSGPAAGSLGAYLHGLAADLAVASAAARIAAQRSLLPRDVVEALPLAVRACEDGQEGPRTRIRRWGSTSPGETAKRRAPQSW
ncbi:MAG: NAD(P)H-hydrate dehydratase [Candidatus Eisenbacteria bacterium]|nr:NAD(P)H-hydrate dehydratase [Candidatus Eisenbacteria bacterium]